MTSFALLVSLWLAPSCAGVAADGPSLGALAAASGRPAECALAGRRARKPTVWQRAKKPQLLPYCNHVARSHATLEQDPKAALEAAEQAEAAWPGQPGAHVAKGRALLALGKATEALTELEAARAIDGDALEDPKSMRDHARALVAVHRIADAAVVYRTLVPRASLLPDRQRLVVLLEAAYASMSAASRAAPSEVPLAERLSEARAFLAEARTSETSPLAPDVLLADALVTDRAGDAPRAAALIAEIARSGARPRDPTTPYVTEPADADAIGALGLEAKDPAAAAALWQRYLESAGGSPFVAQAKARLGALGGKKSTPATPRRKKETPP